jgi:hypothetical protein
MARTAGRAGLWVWGILAAAALAQVLALLTIPSWRCAGLIAVGVLGSALTVALLVAMVAGPIAAVASLRESGAWLGLRSVGVRGRALFGSAALWACVIGGAALLSGHVLEPLARAQLRAARVEAAVGLRLYEDRATVVGPWALTNDGGVVRFAGALGEDMAVGSADSVQLDPARSGLAVTLGPGEAHAASGAWALTYDGLTTTVNMGGPASAGGDAGGRVDIAERSSFDLWERVRAGRLNPYERWIWWKRTAIPCILLIVAALGLPLGARVGPGIGAGALGTVFWALLRGSDAVAQSAGPGWALATLGVPTALAAAIGWATWRDR